MSLKMQSNITMIAALLGITLLLATCSGHRNGSHDLTADLTPLPQLASAPVPPPPHLELEEANSQIASAAVPDGVSTDLWSQLTVELWNVLQASADNKFVSEPPNGPQNDLFDLSFVYEGEQVTGMQWSYVNCGDYNQDGLVSVNDLTPVGQNFNATSSDADWPSARLADGNADGMVTVNDITPIGQSFGCSLGGYHVYGSDGENGPWTLVSSITYAEATGDTWLEFFFPLSPADLEFGWFWVVPYDMEGWEPAGGDPAIVELGQDIAQVSQMIGAAGGTVYAPASSPIEGVYVEFPEGALLGQTEVSLGYNTGYIVPVIGEFIEPILTLSAGETTEFAAPVSINVPFNPEQGFPIPYYINEDGTLELMTITGVDNESGILTYATFHASLFAHLLDIRMLATLADKPAIWRDYYSSDTGFHPALDGMSLNNNDADNFYPDGVCLGMTGYCQWYFEKKRHPSTSSTFLCYAHKNSIVGLATSTTIQELIAVRAFTSATASVMPIVLMLAEQRFIKHSQVYVIATNAIMNTKQPQLIAVYRTGLQPGHSVLAYKFRDGRIFTYDPNYPYVSQGLLFDENGNDVSATSGGYTQAYCDGYGTKYLYEPFENIYEDAKLPKPFAGSDVATIQISSHTDGSRAATKQIALNGKVESGFTLIEQLEVQLHGSSYKASLPYSGDFTISLPIQDGKNELTFITRGQKQTDYISPWLGVINAENNYTGKVFTIYGPEAPPPGIISVEITYGAAAEPLNPSFGTTLRTPMLVDENDELRVFWIGTDSGDMGSADSLPYITCQNMTTYDGNGWILNGREVITIHQAFTGIYTCDVSCPQEEDWVKHGITAKIYEGTTLLHSLTAPTDISGRMWDTVSWHIFSYSGHEQKLYLENYIR
jgi:hypothetical protein